MFKLWITTSFLFSDKKHESNFRRVKGITPNYLIQIMLKNLPLKLTGVEKTA